MAKVSLRKYNQEIENLVDRGQLDEAIAHCRHVLKTFPKNLESYRLIGKAYLEAKRYKEAIDIFERLLMAVPDDFVAHVGMSIINDEQKKLDAAIWHMQSAFEVQPSNAAIQAELQRLYGRRDGVEPPKIRLTRGALAHMYVQGELYPQAISEIKSVLEEDRERHDMQVLLARAYFLAGQKSEAAEMCSQLLRGYPYCLDANRVLVELFPETEHGENVQTYRQRVYEMDPYAAYATGSVFRSDEVSDAAVSLERLEWDGELVEMGPAWSESLGIGREERTAETDEEPDWLKTALTPETTAAPMPSGEPASAPGSLLPIHTEGGEYEIPEFLREAGWGESTGTFQEAPGIFDASDEGTEEPVLAEGDLPDWVKAMAPTGVDVGSVTPQVEPGEDLLRDDVPDWLQGLGDAQSAPIDEQPLTTGEDIPDWLESMKPTEEAASQPEEQPAAAAVSDEELPDWLESMQSEEGQAAAHVPPQETLQEPVSKAPVAEEEFLGDFQLGDEMLAVPVDADKTDTGSLGTSTEEQDDAIAWLEGLAAKHGAKPEELVTKPEDRMEIEPDWIQQARQAGAGESPAVSEEPVDEVAMLPDLPKGLVEDEVAPTGEPAVAIDPTDTGELGTSAEEQDDAIAWLEGLAAKHGAKPEELVTKPEDRKESEPDWVQKAREAGFEKIEEEAQPEQPVAEEPALSSEADELGTWLQDLGEEEGFVDEQAPKPQRGGDFTNWLSGLQSDESQSGAAPEAEAAPESASEEETQSPDWLQSLEEESTKVSVEEAPTGETAAEELPSWLSGLDSDEVQKPAEPSAVGGDLPDWLRMEAEEEPAQAEPTTPSDWQPAESAEPAQPEQPAPEPVAQVPAPAPVELEPTMELPATPEREPNREPVTRSRSGMTGMLSAAPDTTLRQAQNELTRGNIPAAMENYGKLIKRGKMLDEIIFDLREALYRYPVEVAILQTLGDAYMRANRLQEALDTYTKAEELLR